MDTCLRSLASLLSASLLMAAPALAQEQPKTKAEEFAYNAFCAGDAGKLKTTLSMLNTGQLEKPRLFPLAFAAFKACPDVNTGPWYSGGAFWQGPTSSSVAFIFTMNGEPDNGSAALPVWRKVKLFETDGEEKNALGSTVKRVRETGDAAVFSKYRILDHAIYAIVAYDLGFTGDLGNLNGSSTVVKDNAWSKDDLYRTVRRMPENYPDQHPYHNKYTLIDTPDCFGYPAIYHAFRNGRNSAIAGLLERGAKVDFDVPNLPNPDGVLKDFTMPSDVKGANENLLLAGDNSCMDFATSRPVDSKIVDHYKEAGLTIPFAEYVLLHYDRREHDSEQLLDILGKSKSVPSGAIYYVITSARFGSITDEGTTKLINLLKQKGADINYKNENGDTVLGKLMNSGIGETEMKTLRDMGAEM